MQTNKYSKLNSIIHKYKNYPKQGSLKWLKKRERTIGGSEMSYFGKNYSLRKLAKIKLGLEKFTGNDYTRWGNVFENVSKSILEDIIGCHIMETSSIPYMFDENTGKPICAYSPDGLMVLQEHLWSHIDFILALFGKPPLDVPHKTLLILLEFKCPSTRVLASEIPEQYRYQIWSGLSALPDCDISLYMDARYSITHVGDISAKISGFMIYYSSIRGSRDEEPEILSADNMKWVHAVFRKYVDGLLTTQPESYLYFHHKVYIHDEASTMADDIKSVIFAHNNTNTSSPYRPKYIISWRLDDVSILPEIRHPCFPESVRPNILEFWEKIESLRGLKDLSWEHVYEVF